MTSARLSPKYIFSQGYDGASLMFGRHGGVQRLLKKKKKYINYIVKYRTSTVLTTNFIWWWFMPCPAKQLSGSFSTVLPDMLYKFIRKPTVAVQYKRQDSGVLDQRWTGHLATVNVVVKSFHDILTLLIKAFFSLNTLFKRFNHSPSRQTDYYKQKIWIY